MNTTNETITLGTSMGLEIDFTRIEYKDPNFNGPRRLFTLQPQPTFIPGTKPNAAESDGLRRCRRPTKQPYGCP